MILRLGDCLEVMKSIPDKSVDAVITDPPYNIGKADWDKIENYINWCGSWIIECQRVLKDNGSFYFFHNDMEQIADLMLWIRNNTRFVFKRMIVWNKRFEGASNKGFLDGFVVPDGLRNYQQMAEYCLFYTFQDETGLSRVMSDYGNFTTIKNYLRSEKNKYERTGLSIKDALNWTTHFHTFAEGQSFGFPTEKTYKELQMLTGLFSREYEDLRREYEDLRREYEGLRYTFNNQKTHHSVWNYEIAPRLNHVTPKPVSLIENIIKHSTNENYTILDPFMGSGTTGVACVQTGRNFIGIEISEEYFRIAEKRIAEAQQQLRLI